MTKIIPLTQGKVALVDDDDFGWLSRWKWTYQPGGYAYRFIGSKKDRQKIYMHREIMHTPVGMDTDHVDKTIECDNRKENLRICTISQDLANSRVASTNTSGFRGVSYCRNRVNQNKMWESKIEVNQKNNTFG